MNTSSLIPSALSHHPYASAMFAGGCAGGVVMFVYAGLGAVVSGADRLSAWSVLLILGVGVFCLVFAWSVAVGRISSGRRLELGASVILCLVFATALAEMIDTPARAEVLTTQCCLVLVVAGVVIRTPRVLLVLAAGDLAAWTVTVHLVHSPHFVPNDWWVTWLLTASVTYSVFFVIRSERGAEVAVRKAAQSSSWRDSLTGLTNRRGFGRQATQLVALAERRGEPLWCVFLDVDRFKSINDSLGHDVGDEVLVAVADALRAISRAADLPCRWGGDEFVLLGLGEPPHEHEVEQRVAQQLSGLDAEIKRLWTPAVTVGVATTDTYGDGALTELITAADHRMYGRRDGRREGRADRLPAPVAVSRPEAATGR